MIGLCGLAQAFVKTLKRDQGATERFAIVFDRPVLNLDNYVMTKAISNGRFGLNSIANGALKGSAVLWFLTAVIGQWIFVYYVAAYFGPLVLQGGAEALSKTHLPNGYIAGDIAGNAAMVAHLFLAVVIIASLPLQLIPQIRQHFPAFHRWNGRILMATIYATSIAGLYLVWTREIAISFIANLGISLDAVLIMIFAAIALRYAIARKIDIHHRWALRLFMVVNGVWFFRIGLMLWFLATGGAGIDTETFTGPFLDFLSFADYLLPLAILEIYLRTKDRAGAGGKFAMAAALLVLTVAMGVGIFAATIGMWLPNL